MYRRKLRHSRVKNLYEFASAKNGNVLTVESTLEFDACFHFEYSNDIQSFEAQPIGFHYNYEAKTLPYTPDFRLINVSGVATFVEIKPASFF
ncbi:TnsA endonuclease N-terminal domain family protein [Halomonas sp. GFAJ-1]|uniref:TnsA endonuclease N-terminal domain family protein n=1 Tax=Halomonas sp. GFAJ-1 TaxID=1118153 RepID=UPI00023A3CBE|nr:TnsA endonuclease N-terminal domain family protein [Halomonas sp. GFAJ-1]EHK62474.1 TnsA endonuclease N-terminal domain family protein [Halomonas sp. GFAJ-1]